MVDMGLSSKRDGVRARREEQAVQEAETDAAVRRTTNVLETAGISENYSAMAHPLRLVLDTNVWLDWLVFDDPAIVPIREALAAKRIEIAIDPACEAELERALAYDFGRRSIDAAAQARSLAECRRLARRVDAVLPETERAGLPASRDADDQKFLEAALAARADFLLTKDRALLHLVRRRALPFRIVTPQAFAAAAPRGE
jgi:uncharacterized protein